MPSTFALFMTLTLVACVSRAEPKDSTQTQVAQTQVAQTHPGDTVTESKTERDGHEEARIVKKSSFEEPGGKCLETLLVDRDHSVLSQQRDLGGTTADFASVYRAANIFPDTFTPVASVARYRIGGSPLLWFTEGAKEAVVNAAVVTSLRVAQVAKDELRDSFSIGALTEMGNGKIGGRDLLKYLLYSDTILTYVHIGSELCIESENQRSGGYEAVVTGTHTYFTSEEHRSPLRFRFRLSAEGKMSLEEF